MINVRFTKKEFRSNLGWSIKERLQRSGERGRDSGWE